MKNLITKALALGLGLGAAGKEQADKLAKKIEKQMGLTKKESKTIVKDLITRGEKIRKDLDKQVNETVNSVIDRIVPVSRKEFEDYKTASKPPKRSTKKTTKKAAKKTAKTASKKAAKPKSDSSAG